MRIIEIVDDVGDEFSVMNICIPFYIRCKLNDGLTKYRVKILDESDHLRGFYTGASKRDFLELHVPVIPLQNYGKLFIHIELGGENLDDKVTHETSIEYVDQETYESVTGKIREESSSEEHPPKTIVQDTSHQLSYQEVKYLTLGEEDKTIDDQQDVHSVSSTLPSFETLSESDDQSPELSSDELNYLAQRAEILQEELFQPSDERIKEISDIRGDQEE